VVGRRGRKIPAMPRKVETDPPKISKPLIIGFLGLWLGVILSGIVSF